MVYVTKRFQRQAVTDGILDQSFVRRELCESVPMYPLRVRAAQLPVDKTKRRVPHGYLRSPFHRNPIETDLIIDERAFLNWDQPRRDYLKIHLRRSNAFEIAGVGKEFEDIRERKFQRQFS